MTRPIGSLAREIVLRAIVNCDDDADRKERIMTARSLGLMSESDAETLLKIYELETA